MTSPRLLALTATFFLTAVLSAAEAPLLLAHYMPWYQGPSSDAGWGWHWTMGRFEPDQWKWDAQRRVASHEYPLTGPYDSTDDRVLECQVQLMKLAGLDGVIIDWYGTGNYQDYAANHRRTEKLIPWLKKAGIRFAICYEDQAAGQGKADGFEALRQAQGDLQWAEQHWFNDAAYLKQEGRPLLLVFGPRLLKAEQWTSLRGALTTKPLIYGLPHLTKSHGLDGSFGWPPVTGGKSLSTAQWKKELDALYERQKGGERVIASAFPAFKDIYAQARVHASYGSISDEDGATFRESLDQALKSGAPMVQVATWNDYGEGTVIEPTRGCGYRYLEMLQQVTPQRGRNAAELRLPVLLLQLRQRSPESKAELDQASALLFESKHAEADALLTKVSARLGCEQPATFADGSSAPDAHYRLHTDVLYREGKDMPSEARQRCRLDVYYPAGRKPFSTLIWFHGGGLTKGGRSIPLALRNQGIAVVAADYRLMPFVKGEVCIEDAAAAIAWTLKHIGEYGGSADRVFVSGHSAGAYLTLMAGMDKHWLAEQGADADKLAGLLPLSPQVITHFAIREERGIDKTQAVVDELAPLHFVRKTVPPMLIVTGDREKELLGRYEENAYFWRMMKIVGHPDVTLRELSGYDHGGMPEPAFPLVLKFIQDHQPK